MNIKGVVVKKHIIEKSVTVVGKLNLTEERVAALSSDELKGLNEQVSQRAERLGRFFSDDVSLEILYPKDLSNRGIKNCSAYLRRETNRASIESEGGGRPYGFNYRDSPDPKKTQGY